jgi:hypothetical protein
MLHEKHRFEVKPDTAAYGMLLIRALGPILILVFGFSVVTSKVSVDSGGSAMLTAIAASVWFFFFFVGLLRRLFCQITISRVNGYFEMVEKGLFKREEKTWPIGSCFKIIKINTLGYLPRIQAYDKFQFGQFLSMRQQSLLLSWLSE